MIETIYITDPDDPLVPLISEAARGRLKLRLHPPHETLELSPGADAVLVGDQRLPAPIIRLTGAKLVQLTRGDHPDVDVEDPEMTAGIVVHTVEALTHKLVIHPTPGMDREAYREAVVRLVVNFVVPGEASSPRARAAALHR